MLDLSSAFQKGMETLSNDYVSRAKELIALTKSKGIKIVFSADLESF